eukprot:3375336-Rhodomonas_salina.3
MLSADSGQLETPNTHLKNVELLYQEFVQLFLTGVNLERFLIYMCNAAPADSTDPISNTVVTILSSPINISLCNVGVKAFKTTNLAALPYYLLDKQQADFIRKLVDAVQQGLNCTVSSDSNGGFYLRFPSLVQHMHVDKQSVLDHLSNAILNTSGYGDAATKKRVVDILIQRIGVLTVIPSMKKGK